MNARRCPWCNNHPKIEQAAQFVPHLGNRAKARMYCECGACGPWGNVCSDERDAAVSAAAAWDVLTHSGALPR